MKSTFVKDYKFKKFINKNISGKTFKEFTDLIYLSFDHEMNVRCSQIYTYLEQYKNLDIAEIRNIYKKSELYFEFLNNFDVSKFISKFDISDLLKMVNEFNTDMGYKNITEIELSRYFNNWNRFFKKQYLKYNKKIDKIIYSVKNENYYSGYENIKELIKEALTKEIDNNVKKFYECINFQL